MVDQIMVPDFLREKIQISWGIRDCTKMGKYLDSLEFSENLKTKG